MEERWTGGQTRRAEKKKDIREGKKNTHMFTYAGPTSEPRAALPMLI